MGFWQSLVGTKAHCAGCGLVVDPNHAIREGEDLYCSQACRAQVVRLSQPPVSADQAPSSGAPTAQMRRPGPGNDPHR